MHIKGFTSSELAGIESGKEALLRMAPYLGQLQERLTDIEVSLQNHAPIAACFFLCSGDGTPLPIQPSVLRSVGLKDFSLEDPVALNAKAIASALQVLTASFERPGVLPKTKHIKAGAKISQGIMEGLVNNLHQLKSELGREKNNEATETNNKIDHCIAFLQNTVVPEMKASDFDRRIARAAKLLGTAQTQKRCSIGGNVLLAATLIPGTLAARSAQAEDNAKDTYTFACTAAALAALGGLTKRKSHVQALEKDAASGVPLASR